MTGESAKEKTKKLLLLAQAREKWAMEQLVEENQGLVFAVVRRFERRTGYASVEREDLVQIGMIGLVKAIQRFDVSRDVCFSTYAMPLIIGELKRFLRDDGMVKVSRSLKETGIRLKHLQEEIEMQTGGAVSMEQLQESSGMSAETIALAFEACEQVESLQSATVKTEGKELLLEDTVADSADEHAKVLDQVLVEELLESFGMSERQLIFYRYYEEKTQQEVAKILGMTQVQVSRKEKKLLEKMRKLM